MGIFFQLSFTRFSFQTRLGRLIFDSSSDINVQSRANAIQTGIPKAIFVMAQNTPGGPESVFKDPNGFLSYTTQTYVRCCPCSMTTSPDEESRRLDISLWQQSQITLCK